MPAPLRWCAVASARTEESSRLTRSLIVAFAFAATVAVIAGPVFAAMTPTAPFPDPTVPLQDRLAMVSGALDFAFWLLLLSMVLSRLHPQPRSLNIWLAGLAAAVTVYAVAEVTLVGVPSWLQNLDDGNFHWSAQAGVKLVLRVMVIGVSSVVAWSMIRWVRLPGDASASPEVVVAELVDR